MSKRKKAKLTATQWSAIATVAASFVVILGFMGIKSIPDWISSLSDAGRLEAEPIDLPPEKWLNIHDIPVPEYVKLKPEGISRTNLSISEDSYEEFGVSPANRLIQLEESGHIEVYNWHYIPDHEDTAQQIQMMYIALSIFRDTDSAFHDAEIDINDVIDKSVPEQMEEKLSSTVVEFEDIGQFSKCVIVVANGYNKKVVNCLFQRYNVVFVMGYSDYRSQTETDLYSFLRDIGMNLDYQITKQANQ